MRFTRAAIHTSKEAPKDADSANARLLTQGGFIHRELAGVYTYLSLGKRVLKKIEQIVREEMCSVDSVEIGMPALTPIENWIQSGRDQVDIAYRPSEKTILGWSHEEIVTPLAREYISSWKDLPLSLFQIQTKFRNEARAKAGVLRGREFLMKDAYSFHATQEDLDQYYQQMLQAYLRVYARCGLKAYAIEASGGVFTQKISHEFSVITKVGEDVVIFEEVKGKLKNPQNAEIATGIPPQAIFSPSAKLEKRTVKRPNSITETAKIFGLQEYEILKTVVFALPKGKEVELVGISLRGDLEVNLSKVMAYFQNDRVRPASGEELINAGLVQGFISPIRNTKIPFYADESVKEMTNCNTGANEPDQDYFQANAERDATFTDWSDFVLVKEGFTSKQTGNPLKSEKCIEAGNIFDLGTKYSDVFNIRFTDKDGTAKTPVMGCYGIGVSRLMGTIVEAHHDEKGILWPKSVAPYQVVIIPLGKSESLEFATSLKKAQELEQELEKSGIEALLDDREESAGKKFADADLIGIPLRIVVSPRTLEKNAVEWKERANAEAEEVEIEKVAARIKNFFLPK